MTTSATLRKAAVLIRSLDADAAATLLARLTPAEALEVRRAIQALGEIDDEEQADVSAEFRRSGAIAQESPQRGVELELSTSARNAEPQAATTRAVPRPFEFLEQARIESLVPYLAREHAQTVAVVLSYLAPARAAQLLSALPEKLQAAAVERLSTLGDTDPASLQVLERELADWVARQQATRTRPVHHIDTAAAILAAADPAVRRGILTSLAKYNQHLAEQLVPSTPAEAVAHVGLRVSDPPLPSVPPEIRRPQPVGELLPQVHFDDLTRFDDSVLKAVLQAVDTDVLVLALVGASEELVERICEPMPGKLAKQFRRRLQDCGPTRLRDVETAQQEVAAVAAKVLHARRALRQAIQI